MKILIDLQGAQATHRKRGIGRYAMSVAQAVVRRRGAHEVHLLLNAHYPEAIDEVRTNFHGLLPRDHIHVWQACPPFDQARPENDHRRQLASQIRHAVIGEIAPDVLLLTSVFEDPHSAASVTLDPAGPPTAAILYDLIPWVHPQLYLTSPESMAWYQDRLHELRKADMLLAISEHTREEAIALLDWPDERVINISADCDEIFAQSQVLPARRETWPTRYGLNRPFLMYTGGIDPRKNIERLIKAYAALPADVRQAHQLLIVCAISDEDRRRLQHEASTSGLKEDELILTGYVGEAELLAFYNACKAFVFPSWHEGFGLPVLEAMRCGKAVIASGVTSLPEVVGVSEALFDPLNEEDIRARIQWVLCDDVARERLERGSQSQAQKFNWDDTADRVIKALERCFRPTRPLAAQTRPRLACVSPLPPEHSGISDYTAQLLRVLNRYYDVEVIVNQSEISDDWLRESFPIRSVAWFEVHSSEYDRVLYHFGNSSFHNHMLALIERVPGVVVLHDFYLSGLRSNALAGKSDRQWRKMLYKEHGYPALVDDKESLDRSDVVWEYPCNLAVLQSAIGVIVHSEFTRQLAQRWHGQGAAQDWTLIPLLRHSPSMPPPQDRTMYRQALDLPPDAFVVCAFGLIGRHKLNHFLIDAFAATALARDPRCLLVFVGANDSGPYGSEFLEQIEQTGLGDRIRITGWTSAQDYQRYLAVADAAVQLRSRSRGETSAAVLDCMAYGVPTIVNANGSMAELDASAVWVLPDHFYVHELCHALETLWRKSELGKSIAQNARSLIAHRHAPQGCALRYRDAIEKYYQHADQSLLGLIARQREQNLSATQRLNVAEVLAKNFPPTPRPKKLLVDISELVRHDARTGIQRVTRALLGEWLRMRCPGWSIEPVWASAHEPGYRYAHQYASQLMGLANDWAEDGLVKPCPGDVFLGLDLQPQIVPAQKQTLQEWHRQGVLVRFVVFDLLPVQYPEFFPPGAAENFECWLQTIAEFDGALCISRSTQQALHDWLQRNLPHRHHQFALDWFHLGSDLERSVPTLGVPEQSQAMLASLQTHPTFLMVGTLEPRKGHAQVLDAFERLWLAGHRLTLVIVGKQGWMVDDLMDRIHAHPEKNIHLHWLQGVSDEFLTMLYKSSTALIAASYAEGYGLPLIEAARYGLPVLARDIPVFREVAQEHAFYFGGESGLELNEAVLCWLALRQKDLHPNPHAMRASSWKKSAQRLLQLIDPELDTSKTHG